MTKEVICATCGCKGEEIKKRGYGQQIRPTMGLLRCLHCINTIVIPPGIPLLNLTGGF